MGILNKFFGPNIGAKVGTAIGIGPVAGQIASETLSAITPGSDTAATVQPQTTGPIETDNSGNQGPPVSHMTFPAGSGNPFVRTNTPPIGDYVVDQFPQNQGRGQTTRAMLPALFGPNLIGGIAAAIAGAIEMYQSGFFSLYKTKPPRFTRKLQSQMRQLIPLVGIDAVAEKFGTTADVIAILLMKRFPARPIVVSRAKIRACEKLAKDVNRAVNAVSGIKRIMPGTTTRRSTRRVGTGTKSSSSKTIAIA